ncbi:MAG: helix-turn-helix transcriptional regulator [Marinobacter sp.]|uniref:helix-turn-helix transcriptional regulator n=1 Tax=Marinobacter sp. TaxID=50741 RepID=UPI00299D1DC5|nr:helix-turn-helix transcriptional regulator [Marinobacter sp.]MDX1755460.1 helix-turn-helix transcriptional regulator [Marinobacter sp.]
MASEALGAMVLAMLEFLRSTGYSHDEVARMAALPRDQLQHNGAGLSPSQLQQLWWLIQQRLATSLSLGLRVRPLILAELERGRVRVEAIAAQLHMSRHTLYKRLKAENLTFAGILEEVRREQALVYLQDSRRPMAEIADRLGFSELSAFSRAFKRWMGCSPAEFRAGALATQG